MIHPQIKRLPGFSLASRAYWAGYRARDRRRVRRIAAQLPDPTRIAGGPFAGMRYLPDAHGSMLLPKLVGSYEAELVAVIGAVVAAHPPVVVDLGAAEGYYAVGLARALPNAEVHAFELDEQARRACQRLADLNGVTVHLHGAASASALASVPLEDAFLLCDIEGAELEVLCTQRVPELLRADLLVEMHDWLVPGVSRLVTERFAHTHVTEIIHSATRTPHEFPAVAGLSTALQVFAIDERRPQQSWVYLKCLQAARPARLSHP